MKLVKYANGVVPIAKVGVKHQSINQSINQSILIFTYKEIRILYRLP